MFYQIFAKIKFKKRKAFFVFICKHVYVRNGAGRNLKFQLSIFFLCVTWFVCVTHVADASQLSEMLLEFWTVGQRILVSSHWTCFRSDEHHLISRQVLEASGEQIGILEPRHNLWSKLGRLVNFISFICTWPTCPLLATSRIEPSSVAMIKLPFGKADKATRAPPSGLTCVRICLLSRSHSHNWPSSPQEYSRWPSSLQTIWLIFNKKRSDWFILT